MLESYDAHSHTHRGLEMLYKADYRQNIECDIPSELMGAFSELEEQILLKADSFRKSLYSSQRSKNHITT